MNNKVKSVLFLFLTSMIWGFAFVAQKQGTDVIGAFTYGGVRFLLGSLSLIPVFLIFEKNKNADMKKTVYTGIVIGIILFVASAFQQYGIMITKSAGKSGFITGLYIVIIPLIEWIVFGRRTNIYIWTSVFLAISGLYLLSIFDNKSFGLGDILLLICAVFFSLHVIAIDRNLDGIYPLKLAFIQFLVCGLLNMTCALIFEDISYDGLMSVKIPILYGSFGSVGIAYTCQILGQRGSSPTASALIMSMESVFSVIGGVIILGEKLSTVSLVGCALMFLGIIVSQINPSEKKI